MTEPLSDHFGRTRGAQPVGPRLLTRQIERFDCGDPTDCICCGEDDPLGECSESPRPCGHHCGHAWTHDACCYCGNATVVDE